MNTSRNKSRVILYVSIVLMLAVTIKLFASERCEQMIYVVKPGESLLGQLQMYNGLFVNTLNKTTDVEKLLGFSWTDDNRLVKSNNILMGKNTPIGVGIHFFITSDNKLIYSKEYPGLKDWKLDVFDLDKNQTINSIEEPILGPIRWCRPFYVEDINNNRVIIVFSVDDFSLPNESNVSYIVYSYDLLKNTFEELFILSGFSSYGSSMTKPIRLSGDSKKLFIFGVYNEVLIVDMEAGKEIGRITKHSYGLPCGDITSDGKLVFSNSVTNELYIFDGTTFELIKTLVIGKDTFFTRLSIVCVATSPDDRFVAVGVFPTGNVYLISVKDLSIRKIYKHGGDVRAVSFSPDSSYLATLGYGYIKTWKLPEDDTLKEE